MTASDAQEGDGRDPVRWGRPARPDRPDPHDAEGRGPRHPSDGGNWTGIGPTIREAVAGAQPRPATPYYAEFSDLLSSGVYAMFPGSHSDSSDAAITELIAGLRAVSPRPRRRALTSLAKGRQRG